MGLLGSITGGLLGIGSSAIQNSQNRQNVRETNQMNYKINQMNNQFNERMAMQQRDFQENMWNKENAYSTASAQRQRLEEAGLNPYLMMNGGSAGTAQSVGSGASASSAFLLILLGTLTSCWLTLISVAMLLVICLVMVYLTNFYFDYDRKI